MGSKGIDRGTRGKSARRMKSRHRARQSRRMGIWAMFAISVMGGAICYELLNAQSPGVTLTGNVNIGFAVTCVDPDTIPDDGRHHFGQAVSSGCDLNGDGTPEIIVGAPEFGATDYGRVFIFSGADMYLIKVLDGEADGSLFGASVDCAGDVNNDGVQDLIVGAPGYSNSAGKFYVYSCDDYSLIDEETGGASGDKLGFRVCNAGDMNGDDSADVMVSAPGKSGGDGWTRIYLGGNELNTGCTDPGENASDSAGIGIAAGCDIDNDDTLDYVVGAPFWNALDRGRAYFMNGSDCVIFLDGAKEGVSADDHFGYSLALCDVNGDNHCDIIVGAPGSVNNTGRFYAYTGVTRTIFPNGIVYGTSPEDLFGFALSCAGDVNNDGIQDILVGAPGVNSDEGKVWVYWRSGTVFAKRTSWEGENGSDKFGYSVSRAWDVDGDNFDDILVGAPMAICAPGVMDRFGKAYLCSGENDNEVLQVFYPKAMMRLTEPLEGDSISAGSTFELVWNIICGYESDSVTLTFSYDGGQTWPDTSKAPNTSSHEWNVPRVVSNSCFVAICGPGTPCDTSEQFSIVWPPSCPYVSVWDGEKFARDDVVLPGAEKRVAGFDVTDHYQLRTQPRVDRREYRIRIEEVEQEQTLADQFELAVIDHVPILRTAVSKNGKMFTYSSLRQPERAIGANGADCTFSLSAEDDFAVDVEADQSVVVSYRSVISSHGARLVIVAGSGPGGCYSRWADPTDRETCLKISPADYPLVDLMDALCHRTNGSTSIVDISDLLPVDGSDLVVELRFPASVPVDFIGLDVSEQVPLEMTPLPLISAVHSVSGDVTSSLLHTDREYAELLPGEHIDLVFEATEPQPGMVRDFILISTGHYKALSDQPSAPKSFKLANYPNPFNPTTEIMFELPAPSRVTIEIFNLLGQKVATILDEYRAAGSHSVMWNGVSNDGTSAPSGVYFCKMTSEDFEESTKMLLVK